MRHVPVFTATLIAVLIAPGVALALNAEATIEVGDKLYGSIETAGEHDRISFDLPRDAELKFTLKAKSDDIALSLVLFPPDAPTTPEPIGDYVSGSPEKVKLKGFPVRVSGTWVLEIRADPGTQGRYQLKTKATFREKWKFQQTIANSEQQGLPFAALWGSKLKIKVKPKDGDPDLAVLRLDGPGGRFPLPPDLKQSDINLNETGEYSLVIENRSATEGVHKTTLKVSTPLDSQTFYLSPEGFGSAPVVDEVEPDRALQGEVVQGVEVSGAGFEEGAIVFLQRDGKDDVPAQDVVVVSDTLVTCTLDLRTLKKGVWGVVVENPSRAQGDDSFNVKDPGSVTLPSGVKNDTEVWYLEFNESFESDLALFGLAGSSSQVNEVAAETAMAYVLYNLREMFGVRGSDGKVRNDAVPLSFVVEEPTSLAGSPGTTYNRLSIGGEIQPGDPAADNPSIPWGLTPIDTANAFYDDLSREASAGRGLFLRALRPVTATSTPSWVAAFAPMVLSPIGPSDERFFRASFTPTSAADATRYRDIDSAVKAFGREVAAVAAHHIARAMGLPNGTSGISSTPSLVGTFADLLPPAFTETELDLLRDAAVPSSLPGSSKTLVATYLRLRNLAQFLLPEVVTLTPTTLEIPTAGGRPDLLPGDLDYEGVSGVIPLGFLVKPGKVEGTAPFTTTPGTWYFGVFRFTLRVEDEETGDVDLKNHRINLVINLDFVPTSQQAQAIGINTQVRATP